MAGSTSKTESSSSSSNELLRWAYMGVAVYAMGMVLRTAYRIRMMAIDEYGPVIHEFDPYFNFRATEYLYEHGAKKFFTWFDYMVWYPLGRPVGTTIYPGMQFTAVWIKRYLLSDWSLNDVCCYIPTWFGAISTFGTGLLAYECTLPQNTHSNILYYIWNVLQNLLSFLSSPNNTNIMQPQMTNDQEEQAAVKEHQAKQAQTQQSWKLPSPALECMIFAMAMMAIVPAHLMRSVGGGYDNESVAISAMVWTFYFWVRSLRHADPYSHWVGVATGLAYFYMVAAWGGYIFVLNMIGTHAAWLVIMGRFSTKLYWSYTLFYGIGTSLAITIPVVGLSPLKSLEQLGPGVVFIGFQLLQACVVYCRRRGMTIRQTWTFTWRVLVGAAVALLVVAAIVAPSGYFGPISSRVRGLFVQHTRTGNPLVDSVAEHQPASSRAYFQYLHHVCSLAPLGFVVALFQLSDSSSFLLAWGTAAYFFSHRMVRLILLTAPIGSTLAGIAAGRAFEWSCRQWWSDGPGANNNTAPAFEDTLSATTSSSSKSKKKKHGIPPAAKAQVIAAAMDNDENGKPLSKESKKRGGKANKKQSLQNAPTVTATATSSTAPPSSFDGFASLYQAAELALNSKEGIFIKRSVAVLILGMGYLVAMTFSKYCWLLGREMSNPTIIVKARLRDGKVIKLDDYREAYWWIRDNTPPDARIMAWWDYGYQITAIANRTTLADGNTWNHEHIALLGRALTTNLEEGYEIARHLADYVLIWGGGGGDDLAKSPHLARIANSVYRDMCPKDPACQAFGFLDRMGTPSPMMERSLLYRLHGHQIKPGVEADPDKFTEVYRSKYGRVRIFKILGVNEESKRWVESPDHRVCDVQGSWFCPGKYPPGLSKILSRKKDFAQLEDFNKKKGDDDDNDNEHDDDLDDEEYQRRYFEGLANHDAFREKVRTGRVPDRRGDKGAAVAAGDSEAPEASPDSSSDDIASANQRAVDVLYNTWENTPETTMMWQLISANRVDDLKAWLEREPAMAFLRSKDGRGPMWWAFEQRNEEITKLLMKAGVPHTDTDANGWTPMDLLQGVAK